MIMGMRDCALVQAICYPFDGAWPTAEASWTPAVADAKFSNKTLFEEDVGVSLKLSNDNKLTSFDQTLMSTRKNHRWI
jgi:hypothetical protein